MITTEQQTFLYAAEMFAGFCRRIEGDAWLLPGLGEWDVRELAGHTLRAVTTVETYLAQSAPEVVACESTAEYFAYAHRLGAAANAAIAERGREAGQALGTTPTLVVDAAVARTRAALEAVGEQDRLINTVAGGMRLVDYLPTRTFELLAHSLDLAAATGLDLDPPAEVVESAARTAAAALVKIGDPVAVFRHLIGRPGGAYVPLFGEAPRAPAGS